MNSTNTAFQMDQALLFNNNNFWIFFDRFDIDSDEEFNATYVAGLDVNAESVQISVE